MYSEMPVNFTNSFILSLLIFFPMVPNWINSFTVAGNLVSNLFDWGIYPIFLYISFDSFFISLPKTFIVPE
jgi:hypothetical protein